MARLDWLEPAVQSSRGTRPDGQYQLTERAAVIQKTPESRYGLIHSGANAVEWQKAVHYYTQHTLRKIVSLHNSDLKHMLVQRLMPIFLVIERKILPPAGERIRRELFRSPNPFEGDFTKRPDKLIRGLLHPQERLKR
jgi:hypothetical protein